MTLCLVSVLVICFNPTKVRLWLHVRFNKYVKIVVSILQKYDYDVVFFSHLDSKSHVSILQKYDYDLH